MDQATVEFVTLQSFSFDDKDIFEPLQSKVNPVLTIGLAAAISLLYMDTQFQARLTFSATWPSKSYFVVSGVAGCAGNISSIVLLGVNHSLVQLKVTWILFISMAAVDATQVGIEQTIYSSFFRLNNS